MKERIFILGVLALLLAILVGLNAASYVQREKIPDSEAVPNRSTYATGPTGTRAFYDLLVSTGQEIIRWEDPMSELSKSDSRVSALVIMGQTRRPIEPDETKQILEWVENGGQLVIVDRDPPAGLLKTTGLWRIEMTNNAEKLTPGELEVLLPSVDPSNSTQMTSGEPALKPLLPTPLSLGVNAIQPSKFVTSLTIDRVMKKVSKSSGGKASAILDDDSAKESLESEKDGALAENTRQDIDGSNGQAITVASESEESPGSEEMVSQTPKIEVEKQENEEVDAEDEYLIDYSKTGPVVHFGSAESAILVEFPYGTGTIVVLTDPYIFSNGGIRLVDNVQLGLNLLSRDGVVAFDEFHQGYGSNQNRLISYFGGTPVVPVFFQLCLLVGLVMFSKSRRFARPLPLSDPSRITKLEYVAAMAQLNKRTKAYDLAIENIYTDFRRRVSRLVGLDNHHTSNEELASAVASRTAFKSGEVAVLMSRCEDVMHGEAAGKKEVLNMAVKIREIESALGLRRGRAAFYK